MAEGMQANAARYNSPGRHGESKGERDRAAQALGRRLGLTSDSARKVLYGDLPYRVAQVIGAFDDVHEWERRERWLTPIRAALLKVSFEPYSKDLLRRAQVVDAQEEISQTDFQSDPSPANRDRYIKDLIEQATTSYAVAMALIHEKRESAA